MQTYGGQSARATVTAAFGSHSFRAEGQRPGSPARTQTRTKRGPDAAEGDSGGRGGRGEPGSSHSVWGEGLSAHADLRGWREEGRGSTFLLLLSQDFLKVGLPVLCGTSGFPLGTRLPHTHTWASFKASSTRVLPVTLSPESSVHWKREALIPGLRPWLHNNFIFQTWNQALRRAGPKPPPV